MKLFNSNLKVFHKGLILVGLPLALELLLIGNLWNLLVQADREQARENRYRQFTAMGSRLMPLTYEAPYFLLSALQGNGDRYLDSYDRDIKEIKKLEAQALELSKNDPLIEDVTNDLKDSMSIILSICDTIAETKRSGSSLNLIHEVHDIQKKFNSSKKLAIERIAVIVKIGQHTTQESEKRILRVRRLMSWILLFGVVSNFLLGAALLVFFRREILYRIKVITENTLLLSQNKELHRPIGGGDEIDQLDQAFHLMHKELSEASKRETSLFINASDVICVLNGQSRFEKINPACERLWYYKTEQVLEFSIFDLLSESEKILFERALTQCKLSSEPQNLELRIRKADNSTAETLWSLYWSAPEQCLYCVVHDISERKQIERAKQRFVALISTELKKPLSSIGDSLSGLLIPTAKLSDIARTKLANTQSNLKRLLQLVSELLEVAEMESSSKMELEFSNLDAAEAVSQAIIDVEGMAQARHISIDNQVNSCACFADKNRVVQILVNLLSNAIKFSPESATVIVAAKDENGLLKLEVIDAGRGVPKSHREAIFEKFKQVEAIDGKRKAGTGLGLPICKEIVEGHNGKIGVSNSEPSGSAFWFTLPRSEADFERLTGQNQIASAQLSKPENAPSVAESEVLNPKQKVKKGAEKKARFQLKLVHKGILLIGVPILFESLFVGTLAFQLAQSDRVRQSELKQRKIAAYSNRMMQGFMKAAVLLTLTKSKDNWIAFEVVYKEILQYRQAIKKLVANDPVAAADFKKLEQSNKKWDDFYVSAAAQMKEGFSSINRNDALDNRTFLLPITANIGRKIMRLVEDVEKKEFEPAKQAQQRKTLGVILLAGLCSNILVSLLLALYFSKDITSRLAQLADNAERLTNGKPLNEVLLGNDEIAHLDQVFHETSEALQAARKKERAVFDNSQDLICSVDASGDFVSVNQASERILGCEPKLLKRRNLYEFVPADQQELMRAALSVEDVTASKHLLVESSLTRDGGTPIYLRWSISKAQEEHQAYCVAHDITSRKEFEQLKQEFLAMVSHDLRSPLTSISATSKLVSTGMFGGIGDREDTLLEEIEIESTRLIELINDLLDLEKFEAGKMHLLLEKVEINQFLRELCVSLLGRSKLRFEFVSETTFLQIDKDRIAQAITNLLNLFLKIDSQAKVLVSTAINNGDLVLRFSSKGETLSSEMCEAAFDRFRENPDFDAKFGMGLALPMSKRILESHDGSIRLLSDHEAGENIFEITLKSSFSSEESNQE